MIRKNVFFSGLVLSFLLGVLVMSYTNTLAQDQNGNVIYACVKNNGNIRIVSQLSSCSNNESPLTWNIQGEPGLAQPVPYISNFALSGADLYSADFRYRDFSGLNLTNINLSGALLSYSDFSGANLSSAYLVGATMNFANLNNANLTGADVQGAGLDNTQLTDANISNSHFYSTSLLNAVGIPTGVETASFFDTICPDGTSSDANGNTCLGHFLP
jgi:uncharacterized protein YjbI with pentapeptide repeats